MSASNATGVRGHWWTCAWSLVVTSLLAGWHIAMPEAMAQSETPESIYKASCSVCHVTGINGAPRIADADAWRGRLTERGRKGLLATALAGKGAMPARGGNLELSDEQISATIEYMLKLIGVDGPNATKTTVAAATAPGQRAPAPAVADGKQTYDAGCQACHASGIAGAPKFGDKASWQARVVGGRDALIGSALKGKGAMPAKGGNPSLTDEQIGAAVDYMIAAVAPAPATASPSAAQAPAAKARTAPTAEAESPGKATSGSSAAAATAKEAKSAPAVVSRVNSFNRLMSPPSQRNAPPLRDGIHDPINQGTAQLQAPKQSFEALPKAGAGNGIDWVIALTEGHIAPRADRDGTGTEMAVMDMNIVREVKGSMPDVVYPHKQHTQWLDCSNCHPAIFIPQKGANVISMASIMLGEKCGVCHGKVAFPVAECRRCHSRNKPTQSASNKGGK